MAKTPRRVRADKAPPALAPEVLPAPAHQENLQIDQGAQPAGKARGGKKQAVADTPAAAVEDIKHLIGKYGTETVRSLVLTLTGG
jgi:hypothetical protein